MPHTQSNSKRKSILPLHIDTTSFTAPSTQNNYPWRRIISSKRQLPWIILMSFFLVSIFLNFTHYRSQTIPNLVFSNDPLPAPPLPDLNHAIIVAGHAIYSGPPDFNSVTQDDYWILESFQKNGQVPTFIQHIDRGLVAAEKDPESLLIFTGGQTRPLAGPRSEAQSYWEIAEILSTKNINFTQQNLMDRVVTEEFARDSQENLLFSLCRFSEITGQYPSRVTVIGFEFKRKRFLDIHRASVRYPIERFEYIGIDPPYNPGGVSEWITGEELNSYGPFQNDIYGCRDGLRQKKLDRNPFRRRNAYRYSCPALVDLLNHCPTNNKIFDGPLPWDGGSI
ncbi:hypothetical protein J3Q64DRAFT_1693730 [Phycomyces blakesleeanus]